MKKYERIYIFRAGVTAADRVRGRLSGHPSTRCRCYYFVRYDNHVPYSFEWKSERYNLYLYIITIIIWLLVYKHWYICIGTRAIIIFIVVQTNDLGSIIQLSSVFEIDLPSKFKRYEIQRRPNGGVFWKNSHGPSVWFKVFMHKKV